MKLFKFWPVIVIFLLTIGFFWKFFFRGLLPVPADTIVGMYHPWRDVVWDNLTAGVPFKNFLVTDPVRQQLPWRKLAIDVFKQGQQPKWNPYSLTGMPLAANLQAAPFYAFNLLFWLFNFETAWGILVFLQPLLAGIFLYLFLRQKKLSQPASLLGAISFAFSGFFVVWLEWNTVLHAALWLPLILLAAEKLTNCELRIRKYFWSFVFVFSLVQSFFAGHLQVFFYVFLFSGIYLVANVTPRGSHGFFRRWRNQPATTPRFQRGSRGVDASPRKLFVFFILYSLFFIFVSFQWKPTWQLVQQSGRSLDQIDWSKPGWFIPWRHLVQFLAPDFFGNPTTLNYWGEWNYGELVGFIGVIPLFLVFWAIVKKRASFFAIFGLVALSFALPTPWAKLIYQWQVPFLSTSQPTRLLFLVGFCLSVLAAYGLEEFLKKSSWKIIWPVIFYVGLWIVILLSNNSNLAVAKRNLILPTGMVLAFSAVIAVEHFASQHSGRGDGHSRRVAIVKKNKFLILNSSFIILSAILLLTVFDLFRFGWKFTPFVKKDWLFPQTKTIEFLQQDPELFRIMAIDRRIMPPNFAVWYGLQDVAGYDPLYLQRYAELIAAMEREEPNIQPPFGFNRIITPQNWGSPLVNLLNVKYVLSLVKLESPDWRLVFQEGETRVYENQKVLPRAFMVYDYQVIKDKQKTIEWLMDKNINLGRAVVLEKEPGLTLEAGAGEVKISEYRGNKVEIQVASEGRGILVLTDAFYPGWQATVSSKGLSASGRDGQLTEIYRADYHFRAVVVPAGKHKIIFEYP